MKFRRLTAIFLPILIMLLCVFLTGCDESGGQVNVNKPENDGNPPATPTSDASGTWTGTVSGYGETITATMTITQNGDSITGTYLLDHEGDTDSGTVNGTLSNGTGTLTFNSSGGTDASGTFVFGDTTATGTFTYGNLTMSITLAKS
jgi:hypothetical protein